MIRCKSGKSIKTSDLAFHNRLVTYANTRNHGHLRIFAHDTRVQFHKVWVLVQVTKLVSNCWI